MSNGVLALDVGNTMITFARLVEGAISHRGRFPHARLQDLLAMLARFDVTEPAAIVSVRPAVAAQLLAGLDRRPVLVAPETLPAPVVNACEPAASVGLDRLFDAAGVAFPPAVVVDAGTAITVDWIDAQGAFRGGSIAPGIGMSLAALHERTGKLPRVSIDPARPIPNRGTNTEDAILCGVVRGSAGLVDRLIDEVAELADPQVVITGGDAELIAGLLRHRCAVDADLMMRGIARAVAALGTSP